MALERHSSERGGGFSLGNPMNLALSIAVYASISKALAALRFSR